MRSNQGSSYMRMVTVVVLVLFIVNQCSEGASSSSTSQPEMEKKLSDVETVSIFIGVGLTALYVLTITYLLYRADKRQKEGLSDELPCQSREQENLAADVQDDDANNATSSSSLSSITLSTGVLYSSPQAISGSN
ncbi:uncharacterized protein LOC116300633 [Actinia tenebrosa]|uniref:Uncharacterized protein LOC116300633 n=1 Tax=Actinia tenebrosa TaxID=6105 RepID=A0A6P8IF93_ACTTE|nr:uncharacterized protein LOC116300633 [Actinia tenebrosa]